MNIGLYPTAQQIQELLRGPSDVPVVMLNLVRFREQAAAAGSAAGVEAYRQYALRMRQIVEERGGRFLWTGRVDSFLIGESDVPFDAVALVEYPSRGVFLEIVNDPRVQEIAAIRAAGLEGQWLIATTASPI